MRKIVVLIGLVFSLAACASCSDFARHGRYQVNSSSMEPTITRGSTVTAEVVKPGGYQPHTGDVVVFDPPQSWGPDGQNLPRIYRVVAVPGDTISCCDAQGRIIRNGAALDEPYVNTSNAVQAAFQPITVPAGELYLLGDNRGVANDSSRHGPVPVENVIAVVKR